MNVTCPGCTTVFRVDPAKVPERGVRARCSVCSGLIAVRRPTVAAPALPPDPRQTTIAAAALAPAPSPAPSPMPTKPVEAPAVPAVPDSHFEAEPPPEAPPPRTTTPPAAPPPAPPWTPEPPKAFEAPLPPVPPVPSPSVDVSRAAGRFSNPFLQQDPSARARRLARALISDLVVYHPEKRQRGLGDGTLKELFADEIRKSWEEYAEQVGEDVANTTPYFTEALNEILAEGRKLFG